jgi:hypothetical protein
MIRRTSLLALAFIASNFSGIATVAGAASAPASAKPTTSLYNCSLLQVRPRNIVLTCADSNRYVKDITWSTWTATSAHAVGTVHWNGCSPSCYDGTWHSERIHFVARDPATVFSHRIFTQLYGPTSAWGTGTRVWLLPTKPE